LQEAGYKEIPLKKVLLIVFAIALSVIFTFTRSVLADETPNGAQIFKDNCASCHIGGGNILIAEKNLKKEALLSYLENYESDPIQAIIYQVQNGKNAMPAFKGKLSESEILQVAAYVFQKTEQGW
jgi:cytochrome c6